MVEVNSPYNAESRSDMASSKRRQGLQSILADLQTLENKRPNCSPVKIARILPDLTFSRMVVFRLLGYSLHRRDMAVPGQEGSDAVAHVHLFPIRRFVNMNSELLPVVAFNYEVFPIDLEQDPYDRVTGQRIRF